MTIQLTAHFRQRVTERLPGIDPDILAATIWGAAQQGQAHYAGRRPTTFEGKPRLARCFQFDMADGTVGSVVLDDNHDAPVFITAWRDPK